MVEPLDELYFKWLYRQVASVRLRNPARTYWSLLRHLYITEFVWTVPNDDNRVEDGRDLRNEFIDELEIDVESSWMDMGCSMLEMLIGLARRLAFEGEGETDEWFWHMLENVDLQQLNDAVYSDQDPGITEHVTAVLDQVIGRTYEPDGQGGLFPLEYPPEDQRTIELWYQMSHYLLERT